MSDKRKKIQELENLVWSIADMLRGHYKQSEYGKIVLPFIVLRRLDCVLEKTKEDVLKKADSLPEDINDEVRNNLLFAAAGDQIQVYNTSHFTFEKLRGQEPGQIHQNLKNYITNFSPEVRDIFVDRFSFVEDLTRLNEKGVLWSVFERFCQIDLHHDKVSNTEMGYLFENLIRRFSEISNETAGEHFTPREVIRLIVDLLIANDREALGGKNFIRWVYDPACGTGGMLALTKEAIRNLNSEVHVELFGQELNDASYAICKSDMLVTGQEPGQIAPDNTLIKDAHADKTFHYMLSNPPYGVDWKNYQGPIKEEEKTKGKQGRFGAGLPRVSDGQLLFLQHMISKMRNDEQGSRIGIVMNGSPLFTGGAGSGESEIRRWMLEENDWVEAIIGLPSGIFYNTGIQTYVWLLNNRKPVERRGKVQLIDASSEKFWEPMRKNLGDKRREIPEQASNEIVHIYANMLNGEGSEDWSDYSKIFATTDFGYREIRIERPLRLNFQSNDERLERLQAEKVIQKLEASEQNELMNTLRTDALNSLFKNRDNFEKVLKEVLEAVNLKITPSVRRAILKALSERDPEADICVDKNGNPEPDVEMRDHERVPLGENWHEYVDREVVPFIPDAWVDESHCDERDKKVGRVGYEINFNQHFYRHVLMRPLEKIDEDIEVLELEIAEMLKEIKT